ncbi:MAG: alpha/beta hydrolase [Salinibacterium sp.]|nr:alpha/beta hydrolase [Salinibacterium sp.]
MARLAPHELRSFTADPIADIEYRLDLDYVGDGVPEHRLDVLRPTDAAAALPVYIYFHGGGWTSGDKAPLTRYCASQAQDGMVVVNVNYRRAPRFQMEHMLHDANEALGWVHAHIGEYGGDPDRLVLGGDSAGGQISALLAAALSRPELAAHYSMSPSVPAASIRGVVQHCSITDFSVIFEKGFVLGLGFVRMLLPGRGRGEHLERAARFLSPVEWIDRNYPPVLVTTSRRDYLYRANLNFIEALRTHGVGVETLVDEHALHTWQQDSRHPASAEVYRRLQSFVRSVTTRAAALQS